MKRKLNLEEEKEKFFILLLVLSAIVALNVVMWTNIVVGIR
jgi:hypothetical protein